MTEISQNLNLFQKIGTTGNRTIYQTEEDGKIVKITIPTEKEDSFEKMNKKLAKDCMEYTDSKKADTKIKTLGSLFGVIGGGLGLILARNKSTLFKTLSLGIGVITGLLGGGLLATGPLLNTTQKYIKELKKYDIKPLEETI